MNEMIAIAKRSDTTTAVANRISSKAGLSFTRTVRYVSLPILWVKKNIRNPTFAIPEIIQ
jgi:hypothetical protein